MHCTRVNTGAGPIWRIVSDGVTFYGRSISEAVARYAEAIAREMNLPEPVRKSICYAAILHDVGKIGIPDSILTKPGDLSAEERDLVAQHPMIGANIVSHVSCMRREVPFIQHHHENWDGSGYPAGLKGAAIPLGARVLRVADSFDAMLMARSYKAGMDWDDALAEIRSGAGSMYDTRVVAALEKNIEAYKLLSVEAQLNVMRMMVIALDRKDNYTFRHSMDVRNMGLKIVQKLGLGKKEMKAYRIGAELHDVGKIYICLLYTSPSPRDS